MIRDKINEVLVSEPPGNYDVIVIADNPLYAELQVDMLKNQYR